MSQNSLERALTLNAAAAFFVLFSRSIPVLVFETLRQRGIHNFTTFFFFVLNQILLGKSPTCILVFDWLQDISLNPVKHFQETLGILLIKGHFPKASF